jgi:predicted transposase YbfD/YdcC
MLKEQLASIFSGVDDPRSLRNQKHPFLSLIGISLLGALAGFDSFSGLADFAEAHHDSLKSIFDLPYGSPSHDTFQRFFDGIDPQQFTDHFILFTENLAQAISEIISVDGKTIRNSTENPLHIVSAWCEANQLVLGQVKIPEKSNEITAIPLLLKLLDLSGKIITIDAIGCQREISQQIIDQGGDYVLGLKGNQKTLFEDVVDYFKTTLSGATWSELDKGHGRFEERICHVIDDIHWLQEQHQWPGLRSVARVISKRTIKDKESIEERYYISSLPADAEKICKTARAHWGIENRLHWRLDVVFNEDKCCIRNDNAAENMGIMRKWALNILNAAKGKSSIKSLQRKASMSFNFMLSLLKGTL